MIAGVGSGSPYLIVSDGQSSMPYSNNATHVRFKGSTFEIDTGNGYWSPVIGNYTSIALDNTAVSAIDWARKKMAEEQYLEHYRAKYPVMNDLLSQRKELDSKIQMVLKLVQDEEKLGTN